MSGTTFPVGPPLSGTLGQGFKPNVNDVDIYPTSQLGTMMPMADGRMFRYVQFGANPGSNAAAAVGQVVTYVAGDFNQTIVDMLAGNRGAGVVVNAIPAGQSPLYSWIQVRGMANLAAAVGGAPAAGAPVTSQGATAGGLTNATTAGLPVHGKYISNTVGSPNTVSLDFPW